MDFDTLTILSRYFDEVAPDYASFIDPAFRPLAESLVEFADIGEGESVIDLGTGTGLTARFAQKLTERVVGVDFSMEMLRAGWGQGGSDLALCDLHRLPFKEGGFDLALANFAFNSTDPAETFAEAFRVLIPGGRLIFHEWGLRDPLSELVSDILIEYMVDEPSSELLAARERLVIPIPWDDIEDGDDLVELLESVGFNPTDLDVVACPVRFSDPSGYIRYKLAWPARRAELAAMDEEIRKLCLSDLHENLMSYVGDDGSLIWEPNLIRVRAVKAAL